MDDLDAVGDAVIGAGAAAVAEPGAGTGSGDGQATETQCLNCGAPLTGEYCHSCGQHAHVRRTLRGFFHDLLHGVLHFEGKFWNTLPLLAWRPGRLTRRYIEGQRARFVSPIALFLFSVFAMFAVVSSMGGPNVEPAKINAGLASDAAKNDAIAARLAAERTAAISAGQSTAALDRKITDARAEARLLRTMAERGVLQGSAVRISDDVPAWLAKPIGAAARNPDLLLYKLRNNAYKYSWALIPISLPFMWLLFPFSRRFRLYDHLIFVTYSLAFMMLLVVAATLVGAIGLGAVAGLMLMIVPPLHMYRQLKETYGLGRAGALWRTMFLVTFAVTAAALFAALLLASGLF